MSTVTPSAFESAPGADGGTRGGRSWAKTAFVLLVGFLLGAATAAAAGLWYLAGGEPDFYTRALEATPPAERRAQAEAFEDRTVELARDLEYGRDWEQRFTQAQVNGWLAEELPARFGDRIPDSVSDPRVDLTRPGLVRLGFRLSNSKFDGVVSLAVRPEVIAPNRLALHVEGLAAGLFPLDPAAFAPQVSKYLDELGLEHEWDLAPAASEADGVAAGAPPGPPVLTVALNPGAGRRSLGRAILEEVEVDGGAVRVAGTRAPAVRLTRR